MMMDGVPKRVNRTRLCLVVYAVASCPNVYTTANKCTTQVSPPNY